MWVMIVMFTLGLSVFAHTVYVAYKAETPDGRQERLHGPVNSAMVCPHCHAGPVRTRDCNSKEGVNGDKVTAALLTGGVSMLFTGLSRNVNRTAARCENCKNSWRF
jgi:hypothetical protein